MQEKIRTIHVYFEEEELLPVEADPVPEEEPTTRHQTLGFCCGLFLSLVCIAIPIVTTFLPYIYPNTYDTTISKTLTLTLSQHPSSGQLRLYALAHIKKTESATVTATGSEHQNVARATGLITFYNGLFTSQTIPIETLKGKDGIPVVTSQSVVIPPATPTTPPTYGTVSVAAYSSISGTVGNIAANDIDIACCGPSILAQNLYPFSGGEDERDIPVLTKSDLSTGSQQLTSQIEEVVHSQAQAEVQPGYIMLSLDCKTNLSANHHAGDQAESAVLTLNETCTPLTYNAADISARAQQRFTIPKGYHLVSFSAFVSQSTLNATGGTLTVQAIAYLKQNAPTISTSHFAGK